MKGGWIYILLVALVASSCANSLFGRRRTTAAAVKGARPPLTVAVIVKNNAKPESVLDLVGDGTGEIGRFCSTGTGSAIGPSACRCVLSWTRSDNARESAEVETTYTESNLLRCGYAGIIPKDVGVVKIKVLISTLGAYSNEMDFGVDSAAGTLDLTNPANFLRVQRHQCRDTATIFQPTPQADGITKGVIYDPFQSDDPSFTYPLDFYATNYGGAMAFYASLNTPDFNCPANPDDNGFGSNFRIYSVDPINGSRLIHDNARQAFTPRSHFYVARAPSGAFTMPLNAYVAPRVASGGIVPSLGYGVYPVRTGNGTETCPTTVPKPPGTHWVKVWQFRATLPKRTFVFSTAVQQAGNILCNPTGGIPRDDCSATTGALNGGNTQTSAGNLADRLFFDMNACAQFQGAIQPCNRGNALSCTTDPNGGQFAGYESFAFGTDVWRLYKDCTTNPPTRDPLNLCNQNRALTPGFVPFEAVNQPRTYTPDLANPRADYLLVVSPVDVNSADMVSENSRATPYIPIRYPSTRDCTVANPTATDCPGGFSYGVDLYDISIPSNPPAGTKQSFPLCALQPDSGGLL